MVFGCSGKEELLGRLIFHAWNWKYENQHTEIKAASVGRSIEVQENMEKLKSLRMFVQLFIHV